MKRINIFILFFGLTLGMTTSVQAEIVNPCNDRGGIIEVGQPMSEGCRSRATEIFDLIERARSAVCQAAGGHYTRGSAAPAAGWFQIGRCERADGAYCDALEDPPSGSGFDSLLFPLLVVNFDRYTKHACRDSGVQNCGKLCIICPPPANSGRGGSVAQSTRQTTCLTDPEKINACPNWIWASEKPCYETLGGAAVSAPDKAGVPGVEW